VTDFLDDRRQEINDRLAELKPQAEEYDRLKDAAKALEGIPPGPTDTPTTSPRPTRRRRGPGRPPGSKTTATPPRALASPKPASAKPTAKRKQGRRKRGSKRSDQALALIRADPGITIPSMAEKMGIKNANYLYRVLPTLEKAGKVRKTGRGYHPETD
jgi:hypothetical protein